MRVCKMCEIEKELSDFYLKSDGKPRSSYCKICYVKTYKKEDGYQKLYYEKNKQKLSSQNKEYRKNNAEKISEYLKNYQRKNIDILKLKQKEFRENNKELVTERKRKYYENLSPEKKEELTIRNRELYHKNKHKDRKREYVNEKLKTDDFFKLKFSIRSLIRNALKRGFTTKSKKTIEILDCSFEEFKLHLESKFDDKMNWENQGTYWHMDHIIPISSAETEEDVYRLNHYTNFQPLYWEDNLKKGSKY